MNHEELDELLGAYALDAVDGPERAELEVYLAANPRARDEVAQHREVASMLGYTGAPAPEGLWDKIAGSLDDRAPAPSELLAPLLGSGRSDGPSRTRATSTSDVSGRSGPGVRGVRILRPWMIPVAGALAAAVVALAVLTVRQNDAPSAAQVALESATTSKATLSGGRSGVVRIAIDGATGYLDASELPTLSADRTYQLWGVLGTQVVNLGVLGRDPDTASFAVDSRLDALAITEEPRGGVLTTDRDPIVTGAV
jgi:anti-sigma factor RsiW